jgi:hypothetical protein
VNSKVLSSHRHAALGLCCSSAHFLFVKRGLVVVVWYHTYNTLVPKTISLRHQSCTAYPKTIPNRESFFQIYSTQSGSTVRGMICTIGVGVLDDHQLPPKKLVVYALSSSKQR